VESRGEGREEEDEGKGGRDDIIQEWWVVELKADGVTYLQSWYLPDMMIFEWYTARLSFLEN
jgi:hypothetical protein